MVKAARRIGLILLFPLWPKCDWQLWFHCRWPHWPLASTGTNRVVSMTELILQFQSPDPIASETTERRPHLSRVEVGDVRVAHLESIDNKDQDG